MKKMSVVKKSIITAVCIALCYVVPLLFHGVQNAGRVFLPMHLPVFLCGLICGWQYGLLCGLAGPALSSLLTSMPPAAMLPSMMLELAVYGCVSGLMMRFIRTKNTYADLYISLIAALLCGRVVAGLMQALTDMRKHLEPDETELRELTDSTLHKLGGITDEQFAELEIMPDFD